MDPSQRALLNAEFNRAAATFGERTRGRFDDMDVVGFSRLKTGAAVMEVGAGTGNFLSLFEETAGSLIGIDLTPGMLEQARTRFPHMLLILGDGARLSFRSRAVELVTTAQTLHHISEPLPVLKEMRRVCSDEGHVMVIDQVATERYEEAASMTGLEFVRDPSHAVSRPPSALRVLVQSAGLEIVDERLVESRQRMSTWMAPGEFPADRCDRVSAFIERFGHETGMGFERDSGEWTFTRRRLMLLAAPGGRGGAQ